MTNTCHIPTIDTFKEEAKSLFNRDPNIQNQSKALDLLARDKYGYKNYATIKPLLKKGVFPLSEHDLNGYIDRHLLENGRNNSGHTDYFIGLGFDFYKTLSKIFFKNKKHYPFIKNKKELLDFQLMLKDERVFLVIKEEIAKHPDDKETQDLLSQLNRVVSNTADILNKHIDDTINWKTPFHEVYSQYQDSFQQLTYYFHATTFFFLSLSMEAMDTDYYKSMEKGRAVNVCQNNKTVQQFIRDLEILIKTSWLHQTEKSFINDVVKNKPIDERVYSYDLLMENTLSIIFKNKTSFVEPMEKLRGGGKIEDMIKFLDYLDDMDIEMQMNELKELKLLS